MRVAIDARKLHDFGIGTYIRNILRQLARIDRQTEYVLICQPGDRELALSLGDNFRVEVNTSPAYSLREQVSIPWTLVRTRARVFHEPHYVLPPLARCRSVVTIHDCIHLRFPQYLRNRAALTYARTQMGAAARRSDRILTVSEASKRDILEFFDVPSEKITVIHNAIDEHFATAPPEDEVRRVAERYQLQERFVLYVGNVKPHKNLERLLDAFHILRRAPDLQDVKLVVIGDEISKYAGAAPRDSSLQPAQVRALSRLPSRRAARHRLSPGVGVRLPVALRRLRPAAARSDGERDAGRHLERVVAARGHRRRRATGGSDQRRGDC